MTKLVFTTLNMYFQVQSCEIPANVRSLLIHLYNGPCGRRPTDLCQVPNEDSKHAGEDKKMSHQRVLLGVFLQSAPGECVPNFLLQSPAT